MTEKKATTAKSKLTFVEPHPDPNMNVMLYGPPKTGKTVGAATAPGPILYLNADRPNATRMAHRRRGDDLREVHVESLQTLLDAAEAIPGDYKTVVLDPLADVYRLILEGLSARALSPQIQQYGDAATHLERFCRWLCDQDVNAVLVAHEIEVPDDDGGVNHLPFVSTKSGSPVLAAKMLAMVDVIGYTGVAEGEGDEPNRYMSTLVNARGRRGGDRFGVLGNARSTDLSEWVELAREAETNSSKEATE